MSTETSTTIFEALRAAHEKQRTLVDVLTETHGESDEDLSFDR